MPADKTTRKALQPACDACHIRRVKCSHDQPCAHCSRLGLTCTYTKAHSAKKTAGKRIEALRQAEKSRQLYSKKDQGVGSWQSGITNSGQFVGSSYESSAASMPPPPRYDGMTNQGGNYSHHLYSSGNASGSGNNNNFIPASPRARMQAMHEAEHQRQVRFQQLPLAPQPPTRSSFSTDYSQTSSSPHHDLPSQSLPPPPPPPQNNMGPPPPQTSVSPPISQFAATMQYRENLPNEMNYLPSPAQFFPQHGMRYGTTIETPNSIPSVENQIMSNDILQSSILPPFSTSMADSLFSNQGVFNADSIFDESTLPPLVAAGQGQQTVLDMLGMCLPSSDTPGSVDSSQLSNSIDHQMQHTTPLGSGNDGGINSNSKGITSRETEAEAHPLSDSILIPTLALFYERLGGVMPVFSRTWLFSRLDKDDHQNDPHFASMLLAMSALVVIQAQPNSDTKVPGGKRLSSRKRRAKATKLLEDSLRARESPSLGQQASLEMCCTSFFIFATLFGLGEHSAGWFRLRESITLAHLCRLHEPAAYESLARDEAERRLRMYWLLAITERAFAIQRGMPIMLTGNPRASTASLRAKFGFKELSDFPDLQLRLFDHVDEKFVNCWNRKCQGPGCPNFDSDRAINLWRAFTDGINQPSSRERSPVEEQDEIEEEKATISKQQNQNLITTLPSSRKQIQRADVEVTRHWLLNRLWLISLNHGLLTIDAQDPPLRVDHAVHVAQSVFDVCESLPMSAMESHGVGFVYKLFDIAQTLVLLCKDAVIAEAVSKGGVGEQLEKQTTAAHTSGKSGNNFVNNSNNNNNNSPKFNSTSSLSNELNSIRDSTNNNNILGSNTSTDGGMNLFSNNTGTTTTTNIDSISSTTSNSSTSFDNNLRLTNLVSGPLSLRKTVLGILMEYLSLFQKFRNGDHPYLEKLLELIEDLKKEMSLNNFNSTMTTTAATTSSIPSNSNSNLIDSSSTSTSTPTTGLHALAAAMNSEQCDNSSIDTIESRQQ